MPDPYNIPLTGAQISTALQATYQIDKTASQVNDAINAAHDTSGAVTSGSTKLVQSGAVYSGIETQLDARDTGAVVTDVGTHLVRSDAVYAEVVAKIRSVTGWAIYEDNQYSSGSPLTSNSAKTQVTINGNGSSTNTTYLPTDVTDFWSTVDNKITPAAEGDAYALRLDFTASPATASDYAEVIFEVNAAALAHRTVSFAKAGATSFSIGLPLAALSDFVTNGCKIYFDTSGSGDAIDIYDISLFIKRDFTALT